MMPETREPVATAETGHDARRPLPPTANVAVALLLLSVALATAVLALGSRRSGTTFHGSELQPPAPAPDFALTSVAGETVRLSDWKGQVVVLYFGYTFCPDVCPATLAKLAQARQVIGEPAATLRVVMITVDPERDTPAALNRYVTAFNSEFLGLTGTPEQIQTVAKAYGIYYRRHEGSAATGYLVDHTASALVIDRQGKLRLLLPYEQSVPEVASDLRILLGEPSP